MRWEPCYICSYKIDNSYGLTVSFRSVFISSSRRPFSTKKRRFAAGSLELSEYVSGEPVSPLYRPSWVAIHSANKRSRSSSPAFARANSRALQVESSEYALSILDASPDLSSGESVIRLHALLGRMRTQGRRRGCRLVGSICRGSAHPGLCRRSAWEDVA